MSTLPVTQSPKGFTLIELLLYIGIASVILLASSVFLSLLMESRVKNQTVTEVDQQGVSAMQIITQTLRNAESATMEDGALIVETPGETTTFSISNDALWIQSGSNEPVALTSDRVVTSTLSCTDLALSGTASSMRCALTIAHVNTIGRHIYAFERTMYATGSLR